MNPEQPNQARKKVPFFSSLQLKYAVSYLIVLAVVLALLNTYPVLASQSLLFSSKEDSLKSQAAVMASALMELETLNPDDVSQVMGKLDRMGLDRILVTDAAGLIVYDSLEHPETNGGSAPSSPPETTAYQYALFQEVVLALDGNDVFHSSYADRVFTSSAAVPIVFRGIPIGTVYIYDLDEDQGALLYNLQKNLRNISVVIALVALAISALFSKVLTARIAALLRAIRIVGQGEYGHRLQVKGEDELAQLAQEFNQLTDRLQTTEEVRRRFVADASHELKTPLASIRLLTDSILQDQNIEPDIIRDFVSDIGNETERLDRITQHLLTLTRLDSLPEVNAHPVDLPTVVQQAVDLLVPVAEAADVSLRTDLTDGLTILCTEDELYQVCYNLVENAIKYNFPEGEVLISAYSKDGHAILEVADSGLGIPEDDLPKVFNRFYRVDKARSRAAGGTGLGLSIVRDTVRRHGGWVTVRPRHPNGSIFTVGFPLAPSENKEVGS